jgi:hypothetical protein
VEAKFRGTEVSDSRDFPFGGQKWLVAAWITARRQPEQLHPAMFHELRDGFVRLDPDLTGLLASALMPRFAKAALENANDYAKQLRRITVPRRLVREAPKPIAQRRESWERSVSGSARSRCRARV